MHIRIILGFFWKKKLLIFLQRSRCVSNEQLCLKATGLYDDLLLLIGLFHFFYFILCAPISFSLCFPISASILLLFFNIPSQVFIRASLIAQLVKKKSTWSAGDPCSIPGWEDPLEKHRLPTPVFLGFPYGSACKDLAHNAGDPGSIPGLRRSTREGNSYPVKYSGLEYPWTEQSMRSQRVRHDWATFTFNFQSFIKCSRGCLQEN